MSLLSPETICYGWGTGKIAMPRDLGLSAAAAETEGGYWRGLWLIARKDLRWTRLALILALAGACLCLAALAPEAPSKEEARPAVKKIALVIQWPAEMSAPKPELAARRLETAPLSADTPPPSLPLRQIKTPQATKAHFEPTASAKAEPRRPDAVAAPLELEPQPLRNPSRREGSLSEAKVAARRQTPAMALPPAESTPLLSLAKPVWGGGNRGGSSAMSGGVFPGPELALATEPGSRLSLEPAFHIRRAVGERAERSVHINREESSRLSRPPPDSAAVLTPGKPVYKLGDFSVCVEPNLEFALRTQLASLLNAPQSCEANGCLFRFKGVATAYSLDVEVRADPQALANMIDRCAALESAIRCLTADEKFEVRNSQ